MKKIKFFAAGLALVFAVCSAFTKLPPASHHNGVTDTWYEYNGPTPQSITSRKDASNYIKISSDPGCAQSTNECAVQLNQDFGQNPSFANVTFDSNGFPIGGSAFLNNELKN